MDLDKFKTTELIELYSQIIKTLKARGVIRTNNFIGEIGEHLAIEYYKSNPTLPNLQAAPVGTQNIDAISRDGERYSIKSTSGNTTGVFYGLEPKESTVPDKQKFEYVIVCSFDGDYALDAIYEITWENFLKYKRWHSRMTAWYLALTKNLIADAKIVFKRGINNE